MKYHLQRLADILDSIDNDPQKSMLFVTQSLPSTTQQNCPPKDVRWRIMVDSLYQIECMSRYNRDYRDLDIHLRDDISRSVDQLLEELNGKYHNYQHLCWQSHQHHFHVTIEEYINCPITCLCEMSEFLNKLVKEIYHQ